MKRNFWAWFRFTSISQKIIAGFIFIYILFIVNAVISVITIRQGEQRITYFGTVSHPSIDMLDKFRLSVAESQFYLSRWVYAPNELRQDDKQIIRNIHDEFPDFRDRLGKLMRDWQNPTLAVQMDSVILQYEQLKKAQTEILNKYVEKEDFDNAQIRAEARLIFLRTLPVAAAISRKLEYITEQKKRERNVEESDLLVSFGSLNNIIIIFGTGLIFLGFIVNWWTRRQIVRPIKYINSVFDRLGSGELPEDKHFPFNRDEIGDMATAADKLIYNLKATSEFAEHIGRGEYNYEYKPISEKDILGNALVEMRDNLAKVAQEEQIRRWTNEGLVLFNEILKNNNNDLSQLSEIVVSNLVKYVKANQGALFIEADEADQKNTEQRYLEMRGCYAWDTDKSYLQQKVFLGDGLAGQAWQERATICLDEVPHGYIRITSGLGAANPNAILIAPLKLNEQVYGVVELASFRKFEAHEIAFVEKIAESIASTISTVRTNERTQALLRESTTITEQMRAQEELMRQNMEELQSTQDFLENSQREAKEKEDLLNVAYMLIETDKKFAIKSVNELTRQRLRFEAVDLQGMAIDYLFFAPEKAEEAKTRLSKGQKWTGFAHLKGKNDLRVFSRVSATTIRDEEGIVQKYLFIFDDITDAKA